MSVSCECCVLSDRGSCVGLRSPTERGVSECDREASILRPWPTKGCGAKEKKYRPIRRVSEMQSRVEVVSPARICV